MYQGVFDYLLAKIVDTYPQISDINMTVGCPLQVEVFGNLVPFDYLYPPRS